VEGDVAPNHCCYQITGLFLLAYTLDRMILSSFVWILYQRSLLQAMRPRCKNARNKLLNIVPVNRAQAIVEFESKESKACAEAWGRHSEFFIDIVE